MIIKSFDVEANGLHDADTMWCIVVKELGHDSKRFSLSDNCSGLDYLFDSDIIVGHNILNYDIPLIKRLYGRVPRKGTVVVDTYILSRTLNPDRQRPFNMLGKSGPHSLAAWGYRVGRGKPDHDEWDRYSEAMLHRCVEDVEITELTYLALCKEGSLDHNNPFEGGSDWINALKLEQRIQLYINEVESNGFPVNKADMLRHIDYLSSEMDKLEQELIPSIPSKPKQYGTEVSKPFKKNGDYTKQVLDWFLVEDEEAPPVCGPFSRILWEQINLGSEKQVKEYLLSIGWKPTKWNYKKVTDKESADPASPYYKQTPKREAVDKRGNKIQAGPKLTEDSFDSLQTDIGQRIAYYLRCRHRRSLLQGLVELEEGGRISQRFTGVTSTGRYKHSGVVNIPGTGWFGHEIRDCFVTIPNYKLVGTDAASCQLRMLAHYMNDPDYTETVVSGIEVDESTGIYHGTDIHTVNGIACGLISGDDVAQCRGKTEDWLKENAGEMWARIKLQRRKSKNFIYGFLFGAGPAKIAETIGCPVREAERVMTRFTQALPSLKRLMDNLDRVFKDRGYLLGLDGRKIALRSPHMKLVYLLQAAEATFMKVAWCFLKEGARKQGLDVQSVCFYHDEFQELVHERDVDAYVKLAKESFINAGTYLKLRCPTEGGPKVGDTWGETH